MLLIKLYNRQEQCVQEVVAHGAGLFAPSSVAALCGCIMDKLESPENDAFVAEAWYDGQMVAHFPDFIADLFGGDNEALRNYLQTRKRPAGN